MDKFRVFHANQTSMCLDPHLNQMLGWRHEIGYCSSLNIFTDHSKTVLLLWIIFVIYVSCLSYFFVCASLSCGHLRRKS